MDPELLPLLEAFPDIDLTADKLPAMRERLAVSAKTSRAPEGVHPANAFSQPFESSPGVRLRILRPINAESPLPVYVHIHGGGYVAGSPEGSEQRNGELAAGVGCLVVSVDYRLAPEAPFPNALHDCYSALLWLKSHAHELGIDVARIAVGGESAGAGLAAALCLLARDRAEVNLRFQLLTVPMLDDRTCVRNDLSPFQGEFVWTARSNIFGWSAYLGKKRPGSSNISPYAAAARAQHLSGLPATFIATGALDLFAEENLQYAQRLMRAGVPTELHLYQGAFHGFNLSADAAVARQYARDATEALKRALIRAPVA